MTDFRGATLKEAEMERGTKMVISEVSLGTAGIDVSINEIFGLMLERNINVSNEFTAVSMMNLKTHMLMLMGVSSSIISLAIDHEIVQAVWGMDPHLQITRLNARHNGESESYALTHF